MDYDTNDVFLLEMIKVISLILDNQFIVISNSSDFVSLEHSERKLICSVVNPQLFNTLISI